MDKGKKIAQQIDEEDEISLKRDRFENEGIVESSEEAVHILVKKARLETPLSIPSYHANMAGPRNQACSSHGWGSHIGKGICSSSGELPDTESLVNQINSIAKLQGLDGAPLEAAVVLNSGLEEYIKRIIRPCINLVQSGSYQVTRQDSEVPMQMNKQWLEQLDNMSSLNRNALRESFFPNPATVGGPNSICTGVTGNTSIDLNQDPISGPYSQNPSSGGTDGTESSKANMEIDLNLSPDVHIDLNLIPDIVPVSPVDASASGSHIMSLARVAVGTRTSTSLTQGPILSLIPPWAPNLTSSGSSANTSVGMDMACNLTLTGSGAAASMDRDIPDKLACIGNVAATSTGKDMPENLARAGHGASTDTGTGSIFFIGSPEKVNTESMGNQMEWCLRTGAATSTDMDMPGNLACPGRGAGTDTNTGSIFFIGSPEQVNTESMANQMEWCIGSDVATSTVMDMSENLARSGHGAGTDTGTGSIFFIGSPEQGTTESMANQMEWCIGSGVAAGTVMDMSENLACSGHGAGTDTGTGSIFFIGSPEQGNTESMANQMEWTEIVNGILHTGISSADAVSGGSNLNGWGRIHRTITLQDLQIAVLMDPQLLSGNWPMKLEELLSQSFEE